MAPTRRLEKHKKSKGASAAFLATLRTWDELVRRSSPVRRTANRLSVTTSGMQSSAARKPRPVQVRSPNSRAALPRSQVHISQRRPPQVKAQKKKTV